MYQTIRIATRPQWSVSTVTRTQACRVAFAATCLSALPVGTNPNGMRPRVIPMASMSGKQFVDNYCGIINKFLFFFSSRFKIDSFWILFMKENKR
jgi:hypothetical protein